jgi:hypothetical protein
MSLSYDTIMSLLYKNIKLVFEQYLVGDKKSSKKIDFFKA